MGRDAPHFALRQGQLLHLSSTCSRPYHNGNATIIDRFQQISCSGIFIGMIHRAFLLSGLIFICSQTFAQETQIQYLSGKGIDDAVPWEFMVTGGNKSGEWTTLPVPSCWDVEGFGKLTYGRGEPPSTESGKYKYK